MIKDAHEIECMRLACRATILVYRAVAESLHPGMTTADVRSLIAARLPPRRVRRRSQFECGRVYGAASRLAPAQTLREGSILMLDDGCLVEGYQSDITRTFVLGKPTDKMKAVFELVQRAQTAALHTARPGVPTGDVDAAARKVIVDGGYGPGFKYFTHRVGHGIGMDGHEWPYFVRNNMFGWDLNPKLQAGMTLSDEPGIYIPGEFGIRLEDDLLVTDAGAELLTPQCPRSKTHSPTFPEPERSKPGTGDAQPGLRSAYVAAAGLWPSCGGRETLEARQGNGSIQDDAQIHQCPGTAGRAFAISVAHAIAVEGKGRHGQAG